MNKNDVILLLGGVHHFHMLLCYEWVINMNNQKIGKFIHQCRKEKGLTQKQLGDLLNVSDKSVSKWERGICLPDVSLFIPLCQIFEIDLNELFLGERILQENKDQKIQDSLLPVIYQNQKLSQIKKWIIILFFILFPLIFLQWNLKFYTILSMSYDRHIYLLTLFYIPSYYFILKKRKIGYIFIWLIYILLSFFFLIDCQWHIDWLFNDYSLDFWFHMMITILSLINGDIDYRNLIKAS